MGMAAGMRKIVPPFFTIFHINFTQNVVKICGFGFKKHTKYSILIVCELMN